MLGIKLQRQGEVSLKRQIYLALREQITGGRIKAGEALPSTRELANQLDVSRNTVCEAYEMLAAEVFVISSQGSPTRVADGLCIEKTADFHFTGEPSRSPQPIRADFRTGRPDLRHFPRLQWYQLIRRTYEEMPLEQFGYTGPEGLPWLREEIAAWLFRSKGPVIDPRDIFITAGATHGLHLIAELLVQDGKEILIEDPCHIGMLRVLRSKRCTVHPVPVDERGMQVEYLAGKRAGAVYVTPSHQYPLGGILPAGRRGILLLHEYMENASG